MSEQTNPVEVDPYSEVAGGVDTSYPVLMPDRVGRFTVVSAKKDKGDKENEFIRLRCRLEKEMKFRDGKTARPGFVVSQVLAITPTENYDVDAIKRNIALWLKATLGQDKARQTSFRAFFDNASMIEACVFDARTGVKKDKNGVYADSTTLTPLLPA